jgi:hypothetical protein
MSVYPTGTFFFIIYAAILYPTYAQDVTPKVHWDRIDDVPDAPGNPFLGFANFSWRAFIALNWPALSGDLNRGQPDTTKKLNDPGPRVWETYKARYEVFVPGAPPPAAWESYDGANPCGGAVTNRTKTLSAFSHFADYNQAAMTLDALANPLIDQSRMYTRYEVRFSREEFDSIVDKNNRWFVRGNLPTATSPGTFKVGSIEIKAAWRVLKPDDTAAARARFYTTTAQVLDPVATRTTGSITCNEQEIALTGLHIVIKTKLRPQWIWSSFEHIDNVPPKTDEPDAKSAQMPYSYNSGGPPPGLTQPRPKMISDTNPPASDPAPMQVFRLQAIQPSIMKMNRDYWALLKGTIWANYMLVMTQWPQEPGTPSPTNMGAPPTGAASTLANTTMETYQQRNGRSCMECHQEVSNKLGRDFVAFMAMDATDPPHKAIAAIAERARVAGTSNKVTVGRLSSSPVRKTALDTDPAIQALARMLRP